MQSPWPYLSYLNLCECYLKLEDFQDLSAANDKGFFPNLQSLLICDLFQENSSAVVPLFSHPWPKLTKLVLDNLATDSAKEMSVVWEKSQLLTDLTISLGPNQIPTGFKFEPHAVQNFKSLKVSHFNISMESLMVIIQSWNLTRLDTRHCEGITGMMSGLKYHTYAHLNSLFISNCDLNSGDLNVLAQASVGGRVPQLRHLDISKNQMCAGHLDCLFDNGCKRDSLLVLDIRQIPITRLSKKRAVFAKDSEVLCSKIDSGRLSSLEEASFTMYLFEFPSFEQTVPWSHVTKLNMLLSADNELQGQDGHLIKEMRSFGDNLKPIVRMVQSGILPNLKVLNIVSPPLVLSNAFIADEKYQLAKPTCQCIYQ